MDIQTYSEKWAQEIADVFFQSVHAIDPSVYTPEQKEAWAPSPLDDEHWFKRLSIKKPFVAIIDNHIAGFIELDEDHIGCTYTHPNFQGKGVASTLYNYLLLKAEEAGVERLYVEASLIAKPFFLHRGFSVVQKNEVQRNGVSLINFSMEKNLIPTNQNQPPVDP